MKDVCLSQVCLHAADLVRGKVIHLRDEERAVFEAFSVIGYVHFQPSQHSNALTLCSCRHPALFEFYFYYRWLPSNLDLFRLPPELRQNEFA
ncbi:hypothetical protein SAMN05216600_105289 [Pseudomonas cuatrocienegasensis]|uniref:Uncharacterized protein n=1 Tax=Pseudomonas cuatrocienegasensis TaxID=543360 RepID=A0ABY1BAT9_9PSED|nr:MULTISPECIES: hypothetical protein [Pseudomonas]OEC34897.1 hypothetical protein A7D25_11150 [Pseudomonas sp. 21C1]SEQ40105.1 hypothetical protein SAMN05216600_105289 [Pseudomonas cuatrocienegasensis]